MAQTKTTLRLLGKDVPATEVPIINRIEEPMELQLEDGSLIRVVAPVTSVLRIDNEWDGEGNPVYLVKNGVAVTVIRAKDEYKKK